MPQYIIIGSDLREEVVGEESQDCSAYSVVVPSRMTMVMSEFFMSS